MTRQEIKSLLSRNADDPRKVIAAMMGDANLEEGFKVLLQSSYPAMLLKDRIAIIQDIVDNDRQFYYSSGDVPKGAKYICDIGVCDAGCLYAK